MSDMPDSLPNKPDLGLKIAYILAFSLVIIGLINSTPGIPGLDDFFVDLTGDKTFKIRKFSYEYFYPLVFVIMMLTVALKHSMYREWAQSRRAKRNFGLFMDVALVVMATVISLTYVIEFEAICLIDQLTGERAALIAKALAAEKEFAELYGLPVPDTIEDPQCLNTTGVWLFLIMGLAVVVFLGYNVKVWGLPLVMVAILIASYTILTYGLVFSWSRRHLEIPDDENRRRAASFVGRAPECA